VTERLVGDPVYTLAKKYREECEVVYLGFPPLSAQDGSLQKHDLFGGQTSITERLGRREKGNIKRISAENVGN